MSYPLPTTISRLCWCGLLVLATLFSSGSGAAAQTFDRTQFRNWGITTYNILEHTLRLADSALYAETAHSNGTHSGGVNGRAFAWPLSTQFRVLNSMTKTSPTVYVPILRSFADEFYDGYWSQQSGGYYCCSGGGDRFYDDNAHIAVALAEAFEITHDQVYLDRAIATYDFLLNGEAPGRNGGSYWSVNDHTFLDTASALQGARAGMMLYQATEDPSYFADAELRYNWARDNTQLPGGTFLEKVFLTGPNAGEAGNYDLVNFAGFGISANVEFYAATGDVAYLQEAERIASTSMNRYFDAATGRINDEGFWAFELVDGFVDLYQLDGDPQWLDAVDGALQWLHENKSDPAGHYGKFWGREGPQVGLLSEWDLNDQAAVARAYLHLAITNPPGDFDANGFVNGSDLLSWQRGDTVGLLNVWKENYGSVVSFPSLIASVPEPTGAVLLLLATSSAGGFRGVSKRG